jgi:hypothetical protein
MSDFNRKCVAVFWKRTKASFAPTLRHGFLAAAYFLIGFVLMWNLGSKDLAMEELFGVIATLVTVWNISISPAEVIFEDMKLIGALDTPPSVPPPASNPKPPEPNWAIWKNRTQYSLHDSAAILAKVEPSSSSVTDDSTSYFEFFKEAVEAKRVPYVKEKQTEIGIEGLYERPIDGATHITKDALLGFAEERGYDVSNLKE